MVARCRQRRRAFCCRGLRTRAMAAVSVAASVSKGSVCVSLRCSDPSMQGLLEQLAAWAECTQMPMLRVMTAAMAASGERGRWVGSVWAGATVSLHRYWLPLSSPRGNTVGARPRAGHHVSAPLRGMRRAVHRSPPAHSAGPHRDSTQGPSSRGGAPWGQGRETLDLCSSGPCERFVWWAVEAFSRPSLPGGSKPVRFQVVPIPCRALYWCRAVQLCHSGEGLSAGGCVQRVFG